MAHSSDSLRERKKQQTRSDILEAGRDLFQAQGFDDTSVEQIAAQANISRATFFNYFATKEALLGALADEELIWLQRRIEGELSAEPSAVARIRQAVRLLVEDTWSFLQVTRYVFLDALRHPAGQDASSVKLGDILGHLVREAQQMGEIRTDLDPDEIAQAIGGAYLAALFAQIATVEGHSPTPVSHHEPDKDAQEPGHVGPPLPREPGGVSATVRHSGMLAENIVDMLFEGIACHK
jgi:AcrR family transcriptional regulator